MGSRDKRELLAVGLLTLVAAGLRFSTLGLQSFWFDEALTAAVVQPSLFDTVDALVEREAHPPLYPALAWLWAKLFGESDVAFRALSALIGTLTVPLAYATGKELVSRRAGLITAALAATSPLLIWYSQEARPYELAVLTTTFSLYCFARVLRPDSSQRDVIVWAATSVVAIATHYFAAFPVMAEAALILRAVGLRRHVLIAVASIAVVGLAFIPLARYQASDAQTDWITGTPLSERLTGAAKAFVSGPTGAPGRGFGLFAAVLAMAGGVLLLVKARGSERRGGLLALVIAGTGLASAVFALAGLDFFNARNVIMLWVPVAIAVAAGLAAAGRAGVVMVALLCASLLAIHFAILGDEDYHRTNWQDALETVGEPDERRGLVVAPGFAALLPRHYGHDVSYRGGMPATVREIVILAEKGQAPFSAGDQRWGFTVTDQQAVQKVEITRLRAPEPVEVRPRLIPGEVIGAKDAGLLIEEPPG